MKKPRIKQPAAAALPVPPLILEPTPEEIRKRAYEIYLARGDAPGTALSDWSQAERELRQG